jgi:hypothetical protein
MAISQTIMAINQTIMAISQITMAIRQIIMGISQIIMGISQNRTLVVHGPLARLQTTDNRRLETSVTVAKD